MKRTEGQCEAETRRYREDQESTVKRVILQVKVKKPSNHEKTRSKISSSTEEHDNFNLLRSFDSARRVSMISTKKLSWSRVQASSNFSTRIWSDLGYINNIPNRIVDRSHFNTKMQNNIQCINFVKHTSNISNILERNFMTFKQFSRTISRYSTERGWRGADEFSFVHAPIVHYRVPLSMQWAWNRRSSIWT